MADGLLGSLPVSPPSALTAASTNAAVVNQSTSIWYNFTAFGWAANVTRYAPILEDLVLAGPRMVMKLGSLMSASESIDAGVAQHGSSAAAPHSDVLHSIAADLNISNIIESSFTAPDQHDQLAQEPSRLSATTAATTTTTTITTAATDSARGLGSICSYATSKWALSCMAMAIILNRTYIFAATRRRLRLQWHVRFLLRILPIVLLVSQAQQLLQSIQCQTSPDFSQLRWGAANKSSDLMFSHVNGLLNSMSSTLLFGASDEQSCRAVAMVPTDDTETSRELRGSLSRLWPLFGTFCLSHFLETVSCAVQGRAVATETGMTLFEHSVVFAEVDAAASNRFGWGAFSKSSVPNPTSTTVGGAAALTRAMILKRINTSPEVLLIAFLSAMTHITSNVLGIFDLQARYRLLNTGFWGLCFMGSIVWSAFLFDLDNPASQGLLRFPTVCIIRFVPHVLVSIGIVICLLVYGLALMLSALAPPANEEWSRMSLFQRISYAHENMQANISLSEVRITREMDFYTALLRAGFGAITMASEAVYLNEDGGVNLKRHTWLEEARYREAEELQRQWIGMGLLDSRYDQIGAVGLIPVKGSSLGAANGYGRERAAQKVARGRCDRGLRLGIGAAERGSRWLMALEFFFSINKLLARVAALSILWFLRILRIRARPALLVWLARGSKSPAEADDAVSKSMEAANEKAMSEASTLPNEEEIPPPPDSFDDVEAEFRHLDRTVDEESLKRDLYKYWLEGGLWGSKDSSADYVPDSEDENWDTTSVVTMATSTEQGDETTSGWSSEEGEDDDGQRTPTQRTPTRRTPTQRTPSMTRDNTPFVDSPIGMRDLARLLQPSTAGEREEAEALAAHLQSDRVLTRSGFRRMEKLQRTRILTMPGPSSSPQKSSGRAGRVVKLSPEEEEQLLEQLLLTRRQISQSEASPNFASTNQEADGPPCVVCQCAPRTVIVWPCRCLSLCDECRVSLAMNNFDKCVCCRRDVMSFSRIFVP